MSRETPADALVESVLREMRELSADIDLMDQAVASLLDLNRTDTQCLEWLSRIGSATAGQLAEHIGLTPGAATTVIDRLERAGFVRRCHDHTDRRRVLVEPTPLATVRCPPMYRRLRRESRTLLEGYEVGDLQVVVDFLRRIRRVIGAHTAGLRAGSIDS